ncbi:DUF1223 domain-containing protein [Allorhizobium undicola]|uniref:DUF1223 domain-containing protein n=1 Tax=Allorhizobium undicola TaxID=78527 RepID=UPI003D33855B
MGLKRIAAAFAAYVLTAGLALAGETGAVKGVVELFTSQGCNSCPPADRAFETLTRQPGIVALAYHVDYWNYRGWTDTLGSPGNTARQYGYARSFGRNGVYTPQAVINGRVQMKAVDASALSGKINTLAGTEGGLRVKVDAALQGDALAINIGPGSGKADIVVVYFRQQKDVDVLKGENKGQRFTYWNSVSDIQPAGMWHGEAVSLSLPAKKLRDEGSDGIAVLLQSATEKGDPSAIIGATALTIGLTQ